MTLKEFSERHQFTCILYESEFSVWKDNITNKYYLMDSENTLDGELTELKVLSHLKSNIEVDSYYHEVKELANFFPAVYSGRVHSSEYTFEYVWFTE